MPDALRAGLRTALFSFIALFLVSALGWLQQVAEWASSSGHAALPGLSVLGYAVVSAAVSALIGLVNVIVVITQNKTGLGSPPQYSGGISKDQAGNVGILLNLAAAALALTALVAFVSIPLAIAVGAGEIALALILVLFTDARRPPPAVVECHYLPHEDHSRAA